MAKLENIIQDLAVIDKEEKIDIPNLELLRAAKMTALERTEAEQFIVLGMPGLNSYPKDKMLESYLSGLDTIELLEIYPGSTVGGIAYLKFKDGWIEKRKDFLEDLTYKTKLKTIQTKSNAIGTIASLIDAFHKELQPKIIQYLRTGDKTHLPPRFRIRGFSDYQKFLRLFETMSKVSLVAGNVKSQQQDFYPPMQIHADNLTINEKKEEKIIEAKKAPEELSEDSFDFLKDIYEEK